MTDADKVAPPPLGGSPDWDRIPFEVPCRDCGEDLRGHTEPMCQHCGVRFRWEHVLPLEHLRCQKCSYQLIGLPERRCPECGNSFEWSEVLVEARARANRLFESMWYDNPVPGFLRSMWLATLRPTKLWEQYDASAKPKVIALLLFLLAQWVMFGRGWQLVGWAADPIMNGAAELVQRLELLGQRLRFNYNFRPGAYFMPFMALSCLGTFAALQLFFETKRRRGINWTHTLRVFVHATAFASLCTAGWCFTEMILDSTLFVTRAIVRGMPTYNMWARVVYAIGLIVTWAHLWIGLRRHLEISKGWAVSAVCLLIGHLTGALVFIWYLP